MAIIKTKFDRGVEGASNIVDTGTEGTRVATGTTAQRGSTTGQIRFNSTTGLAEYYTGTAFKTIDAPPTITSLDVTEVDSQAGGNQTIVITGSNFNSGATVTFVGNTGTNFNASTVTVDSDTQITAVAPKASFLNAQEPYGVKVENSSGLSVILSSQINVDTSPSWQTASGNLGSIDENTSANFTVSATDADGDTVTYSETTSVLSGAGFSLNSSTGAITGTANSVSADTTNTFTLRATANSKTADRSFNIIVNNAPTGASSSEAFLSLSQGASYISNTSSSSGLYYMNVGTGTSYGQSVIQFYFQNEGANGVYVGMPLGSSSLGGLSGSFLPSTLTNYKTIGQHVKTTVSSGGTQGNFNGSNKFDTTTSTNASANNCVANYALFDLGTEFDYRYFFGDNLTATGSGTSTTDWSDVNGISNNVPTSETFLPPNDEFGDSCWIGLNKTSSTGQLVRPTAWSTTLGNNGQNFGNVTQTGDVGSFASPIDSGASATSKFGLVVLGGVAEHYVIDSGILYFKA